MASPLIQKSIHAVAIIEGVKGALVLVLGLGLLQLLHKDVYTIAYEFIVCVHLNPAQKYPTIFMDLAAHVTDKKLWLFAGLAAIYSAFRFVEGYCLWKEKSWAQWLALVSGAVYLPFEMYEICVKFSYVKVLALVANIVVVGIVAYVLIRKKKQQEISSYS